MSSKKKRGPLVVAKLPWDSTPQSRNAPAPNESSPTSKTKQKPTASAEKKPKPKPKPKPKAEEAATEEPIPNVEVPTPTPPNGALFHTEIDFGQEQPQDDLDLVRCSVCGRSFASDRIEKHQKACSNSGKKRRPVYNATAARLESDALKLYQQTEAKEEPPKPKKSAKWKAEHEFLMQNIKAAKSTDGSSTSAPSVPDPSLVECPHCGRKFSETAAERHIPLCEKLKTKPVGGKAKEQPKKAGRGGGGGGGGGGLTAAATLPVQSSKSSPSGRQQKSKEPAERVPCPHCGRQFEQHAFLRHVDICSKVVNKPKKR